MRTLLILMILLPGLAAAIASPFAALLLYLWYATFRPEDWIYTDISGLKLSFLIGVLLIIRSAAAGTLPYVNHVILPWILLIVSLALLSQLDAVDPSLGWSHLLEFGRLLIIVLLIVALVTTPTRLLMVIAVLAASLGVHSAKAGLVSLAAGGVHFAEGFAGAYSDNNFYALAVVTMLPFMAAAGQNMPRLWLRWSFYASVPLSVFTIVSLFSRGGFLALGTAIIAFAFLQPRRFRALGVVAVAGCLAAYAAPIPEGYLLRVATISQGSEAFVDTENAADQSAAGRVHFWRVAVLMAMDRPFGVGVRNFEAAYDMYDTSDGFFGSRRAVHSTFFQMLAEMGFPGACAYVGLLLHSVLMALRVRRRTIRSACSPQERRLFFTTANAVIVSIAAFVVGGAFLSAAFTDLVWFTIAIAAALDRVSSRAWDPVDIPLHVAAGPAWAPAGTSPTRPAVAFRQPRLRQ